MDEPKNVIWKWIPEKTSFSIYADVASEYAIEKDDDADCGIILWGKYRDEWIPNPWSSRAVILRLLHELGVVKECVI